MNFFSDLKDIFAQPEQKADLLNENPNFVTHPNRIIHMLDALIDDATQIIVGMPDENEFPSKILMLNKEGIIIDQFKSLKGHKNIEIGTKIEIRAKQNAVNLKFKSAVIKKKENKFSGYFIQFPGRVYYPQKRASFRVPLEHLRNITFRATLESSENSLTGHVLDLSTDGLAISVRTEAYLKKGSILAPFSLSLGGGESIICEALVTSINAPTRSSYLRVGCQFKNLDPTAKKTINNFTIKTERNRKRKINKRTET